MCLCLLIWLTLLPQNVHNYYQSHNPKVSYVKFTLFIKHLLDMNHLWQTCQKRYGSDFVYYNMWWNNARVCCMMHLPTPSTDTWVPRVSEVLVQHRVAEGRDGQWQSGTFRELVLGLKLQADCSAHQVVKNSLLTQTSARTCVSVRLVNSLLKVNS